MDNKDLLLGAGIGIIISSVILYIGFFSYFKSNPIISTPIEITLSNDEIISKATDLGMIDPKDIEPSTMSNDYIISEAQKLGMVFESTEQSQESIVSDETTQDSSEIESIEETTVETVKIQIPSGSSATRISQILYDSKLIDDVDKFIQYVRNKNKLNYMKTGVFYISKGSSYEKILDILTNKPSN